MRATRNLERMVEVEEVQEGEEATGVAKETRSKVAVVLEH